MALARLTALGSVVIGAGLAILVPDASGAGLAALVGWLAIALLVLGVGAGEPTAIVFSAVLFVVRITMTSALTGPAVPPAWVQVLMLVLMIELAAMSLEGRTHPRRTSAAFAGAALSGVLAMTIAVVLEPAVYGTAGGGTLLRIGAVAALVMAGGWIMTLWHRAVTRP